MNLAKDHMKLLADVLRVRSFIGSGPDGDDLQMVKAVWVQVQLEESCDVKENGGIPR